MIVLADDDDNIANGNGKQKVAENGSPRSPTGQYRFTSVAADNEICSQIGT